jgi:threonine dehydrogenase-like Zn-dependent dehydrogenase
VLVKSLACGICGSDLHALQHMEHMVALSRARRRAAESPHDRSEALGVPKTGAR